MSNRLQLRKGTTAQNTAFTGAIGELTYDTQKKQLRVHDGSTVGGKSVLDPTDTTNAVTQATETLTGKAKIATTAIAQAGVNDTDFITPLKLKAVTTKLLGTTPTDVTSSRTAGVTYTNPSSNYYLQVCISGYRSGTGVVDFIINGNKFGSIGQSANVALTTNITVLVPPLANYSISNSLLSMYWSEM